MKKYFFSILFLSSILVITHAMVKDGMLVDATYTENTSIEGTDDVLALRPKLKIITDKYPTLLNIYLAETQTNIPENLLFGIYKPARIKYKEVDNTCIFTFFNCMQQKLENNTITFYQPKYIVILDKNSEKIIDYQETESIKPITGFCPFALAKK